MRSFPSLQAQALLSAALVAAAVVSSSCGARAPEARQPPAVQVETIGDAEFTPAIELVSQLSTTSDVALRPQVEGRVVQILVQQGQRVEAGQPILVLDNAQQRASLDAARAEARRDGVNAERFTFLEERGAVSARERDFYVTQAITSRDQARVAEADLAYKVVRAPISGLIGNLSSVQLGDVVSAGQAITGIVDNTSLYTLMDVPATQARQVAMGQTVELQTQTTPPISGRGQVVFISPYFGIRGGQQSPNSVLVKAEFANSTGELKAGMFVKSRIITGRTRQLSVPVQAVQMQAQQPFVYRVLPLAQVLPGIRESTSVPEAQKRKLESLPATTTVVVQAPVRLGRLEGNRYPLLSGLQPGEQVVVSNTALLRSGMPVRIANGPTAPPPPAGRPQG
ncbi:efflux RND transporter periplasmic adaptor subunit [Cyanobium sp. ATX 6A2]|uniref:efflux RND transporter periplasmic adaptor subunit n=1 Tax=Cyanobium sp. ATX 6A2 TaxID=2823700 RepID=UPI0020CDE95E|nr:efflux RND transporter periplasmic adaptor subunit [Cyanobium sp. ATX 6A2]MCP9888430.1 efflux RND transporter periplasmic adaptor subunit [Cyanobium sp. ATX 6A2]